MVDQPTRVTSDASADTDALDAHRYPLLIVDDDPTMCLLVREMAAQSGWTVYEAHDGQEAEGQEEEAQQKQALGPEVEEEEEVPHALVED